MIAQAVTLYFILFMLAFSSLKREDEKALVKQIKKGNHQAFETFFSLHYDSLLHFLLLKNTSEEDAKDLIQKAFIYIWEHRHKIDPDKPLRAYIFKIAYTRMLNHQRNNKKLSVVETVSNQQIEITPEDIIRAKDLKHAIDKAISQMPEKRSAAFQLCFIEDFTYNEAAETLGVTKKTIENHMGLAFKDMRKHLKNFQ